MVTKLHKDSFVEECLKKIFKGMSFEEFGLDLPAVKEVLDVDRIENYKIPLLMLILEDDTLLHIEFMNDMIEPDIKSMMAYDSYIYIKYGIKINTVVFYSGSEESDEIFSNGGSLRYDVKVIGLSKYEGESVFDEIKRIISSRQLIGAKDKAKLLLLPFLKHSSSYPEMFFKVLYLIKEINDEEHQIEYLTAISEIASRFSLNQRRNIVKGGLLETELGFEINQEGMKEGMREAIRIILLKNYGEIPHSIYDTISKQEDISVLMKWIEKVTDINDVQELEEKVFT